MDEDLNIFLRPTFFINSDHPAIKAVVTNLISETDSQRTVSIKLFKFVRDSVRYNPFSPILSKEDYMATTILERRFGFCVQKAVLLAALSRCAGVPCRLCFADIRNYLAPGEIIDLMGTNLFTYHGYNQFFLNRHWIKATPTFDIAMCNKHGFIPVDFDGTNNATFHPTDRLGQKHIEYIRQIGCYDDVPYEDIITAFENTYAKGNPKIQELWMTKSGQ